MDVEKAKRPLFVNNRRKPEDMIAAFMIWGFCYWSVSHPYFFVLVAGANQSLPMSPMYTIDLN